MQHSRSRNRGARDFKIVARGVRRDEPNIQRLVKAALDHYRRQSEQPTPPAARRLSTSNDEVRS
jgi:hypothetical protein